MALIGQWNSGAVSWQAVFDRAQGRSEKVQGELQHRISNPQYPLRNDHKPHTLLKTVKLSAITTKTDGQTLAMIRYKHLSQQCVA